MVPRAYTIVGVASAAVLATLVAASLSTGPILGPQRLRHGAGLPEIVDHPPRVQATGSTGFPAWLIMTLTVLLAMYAIALLLLVAIRRGRQG